MEFRAFSGTWFFVGAFSFFFVKNAESHEEEHGAASIAKNQKH